MAVFGSFITLPDECVDSNNIDTTDTAISPNKTLTTYTMITRLIQMNMKQWQLLTGIPRMFIHISMTIKTSNNKIIELTKDAFNNMNVIGSLICSPINYASVKYTIPYKVLNKFQIQDLMASELLQIKYKVASNTVVSGVQIIELVGIF